MDTSFLTTTELFQGIQPEELSALLGCVRARERSYLEGDVIYRAGDSVSDVGLVESGSVNIVVNHYWGGSNIFGHVRAGQIFAETYAAFPEHELLVDVVAAEDCRIMFLTVAKVLTTCPRACPNHSRASANLTAIIAQQNLALSRRICRSSSV